MSWDNFFIVQAGAAAALTGLIFVAVSINLTSILAAPYLTNRALQSLILLMNILIMSSFMLIPNQSFSFIGTEVLVFAFVLSTITFRLALAILRHTPPKYKKLSRNNLVLTQVAVLPFVAGGICILSLGGSGIYFLVPGVLFSFTKAIVDAWVLLVEINR